MPTPYQFPANSDLSAIGVYNVLDQNYGPGGMSPQKNGQLNAQALQAAINAALENGGGLVLIPSGSYQISGVIEISPPTGASSYGIVITGTSDNTALIQQVSGTTFSVQNISSVNAVRFRDLCIQYAGQNLSGTAIAVTSSSNVTCERVYFSNCPSSFATDKQSSMCGLFECTVNYVMGLANQTALTIMGTDNYVDQCVIAQQPQGGSPSGPSGCTGVYFKSATSCFVTRA